MTTGFCMLIGAAIGFALLFGKPRLTILLCVALFLVALTGCAKNATRVEPTGARDDFRVGKLFSVDGCTVYRFVDAGNLHYFTNCRGSVTDHRTESCGKNCTHSYDVENTTEVSRD